ncbi:37 kDa salivary gland allergen Aed a 2-like [Anopheles maculipalpis]|uniref:37 kDa salivary gland allergen Aed a 2-like n=1 Tax=Anopheles maculipalpis TaxID=1496333 RepID=UPI002158DA7A|nr:37 kDa salivary gland allergen Aed a 2-like [Anopheles maculipalpis]
MIIVAVFVSLLALLAVQASQPWKALDPEQTLYVYKRCYEDHLPSGLNRKAYLTSWNAWKLEPNDAITHCYAKCVLTGLQIFDETKNSFESERIPIQYREYRKLNQAKQSEVSQYQKALAALNPKNGSCVDLYNAYLPVHNQFVNLSRQLYHGTVEGAARIYAARPKLKQKGESFHAYCEKRTWKDKKQSEWKQGRNYKLSGSPELKEAIDCIFRGLRYMDGNRLKVDEIVRDFNLINKSMLEPEVRSVLAGCKGSEAYDYYSCLLKSRLKEDFKKAFDFHELRSADYAYLLRGKVYEGPEKVKEEMKQLNTTVHF